MTDYLCLGLQWVKPLDHYKLLAQCHTHTDLQPAPILDHAASTTQTLVPRDMRPPALILNSWALTVSPGRCAGSEQEGYRITLDFVMAMVEDFKAQRKVHMRFATQIVLSTAAGLRVLPTLVDVHVPDEASFTVCGVRRPQALNPGSLHVEALNTIIICFCVQALHVPDEAFITPAG